MFKGDEHTLDTCDFNHFERIGCVLDGDLAFVEQRGKATLSIAVPFFTCISISLFLLSARSAAQPGRSNSKPDDIFLPLANQPVAGKEASSEIGMLPKYFISTDWRGIGATNLAGSCKLCDQGARYFQIS